MTSAAAEIIDMKLEIVDLANAMRQASVAHGEHEQRTGQAGDEPPT